MNITLPIFRCLVALALGLAMARAQTHYFVSTSGDEANDGSAEKPWPTVDYALSKAGPGHTIIVKAGVFRGPINFSKALAGTAEHPTVIQSEAKWKAVLIGSPQHVIDINADWVVIDGFEILGGRTDGIKMEADHDTVRNCWIHNNSAMGVAMHHRKGGLIEANLIEYNGIHPQLDHGIYADGEDLTVTRNIVRHNAGYGMQLYPEASGFTVTANLIYGHSRKSGLILSCPKGGGHNRLLNNTLAQNNGGIDVWHGDGEVIANNIVMSNKGESLDFKYGTQNMKMEHNWCAPPSNAAGAGSLEGDPEFVDPGKGAFWLKEGSPARGAGAAAYLPEKDFWNRPWPKDSADLGAFRFLPFLTTQEARASWYLGWAYQFSTVPGQEIPDLWASPP